MIAKEVFLLFAVLPIAWAASGYTIITPDKDRPNECPLKAEGISIKVGESITSKSSCERISCSNAKGNKLSIGFATCGMRVFTMGNVLCKMVSDRTKPYPDCCPKPKCPKEGD